MNLARLVAATDHAPFRFLYAGAYRAAAEALRLRLRPVRGVLGVYLTGSCLTRDHVHGVADLDFFVVVARDHDASRLARALEICAALPFLDPFPTLVLDERGEVDDPLLLYRQRAGQLHPLFEQPGFTLGGSLPNACTWLAEVCLQIRRVVEAVRGERDDLYFWKRRLQALKLLVEVTGGTWKAPSGLGLDLPASRLVSRREGRERCLAAFLEGVVALDGTFGMAGVRPPNVPGWGELFGIARLEEVTHASLLREGPWTARVGGFQIALADPRWDGARRAGQLFSWRPLLMTGFAEPVLVISRLERPDAPLWGWTLEQGRRTLAALREQLDDPRLVDSDWGLVQLVQALVILQALPLWPRWRPDVQAHAEGLYPKHKLFLKHLEAYSQALEEGQGPVAALRLPPNFFGYLREFARAMLDLGPFPRPGTLLRKATLTLCLTDPALVGELLASQTRQPDEVVVVDGGREARPPASVRYVHLPGASLAALRARAAREATGEILAFVSEVPGSDWLAGIERWFLRDGRLGATTQPSDPLLPRSAPPRLALRRAALEEAGGYDSSLPAAADEDVARRLRQAGWRVAVSGRPGASPPARLGWAWRLGLSMPRLRRPRTLSLFLSWRGRRLRVLETGALPPGLVCVHPFLLMHLWLLAWLATGNQWLAWPTALCAGLYLAPDPAAALRRYLVNLTLTVAHLVGGLRAGCLYLSDVV